MKDYIERAAVLNLLEKINPVDFGSMFDYSAHGAVNECLHKIRYGVEYISAADVVEVRHGRWIPSESDFDDDDTLFDVEDWCDWQCSVCHEDIFYEYPMERRFLPKFCPNCGARMDKEDEHEAR